MRKIITLFIVFFNIHVHAQVKPFRLYTDSAVLVNDANDLINDFVSKVQKTKPVFTAKPVAILNTRPFLIFYSPGSNQVNLPIWHQVIAPQKDFFYKLAGNEEKGKVMFALFFNGFYLPHEIGHALQYFAKKKKMDRYEGEYFANTIAILYWKKVKRNKELKQCYRYAKKMITQLKNPVPIGEDPVRYFNEHYEELGADPYKYGYYQFAQFVKIYEDRSLIGFDEFIKTYLSE